MKLREIANFITRREKYVDLNEKEVKGNVKNSIKKTENPMKKYKVSSQKVSVYKNNINRQELSNILNRKIEKKQELYENIMDIQKFLAIPFNNVPEARNLIAKKLKEYKEIWGYKRIKKGIRLYEYDKNLCEFYDTKDEKEKNRIKAEILANPELEKELNYYRYYPEKVAQREKLLRYQVVYSEIIREKKEHDNDIER